MSETTIVELLQVAYEKTNAARDQGGAGARDFALACTHLEDAIMRVNRGFAHNQGVFEITDVEAAAR